MRDSSSLAAGFLAGALAGACLAYAVTAPLACRARPAAAAAPQTGSFSLDDEVLGEQLTRNVQFFGLTGQQRVCDAFVIVVGLGVRTLAVLVRAGGRTEC
jgi:hypothetical protein